jgi:calcineurin-like phosphoesterase family protein
MRNIFVTADLHFGHEGILQYTRRPYVSLEEMDDALIENWNSRVHRGDTVYIVGDFAWRRHNHYLQALNGKKILICGNHDRMNREALGNFTEVHDLLVRKILGQPVVFCHYCLAVWPDVYPVGDTPGSWHLYGHSHGRIPESADIRRMDVGVDVWDYHPIPWDVVVAVMRTRGERVLPPLGEAERNVDVLIVRNREYLRQLGQRRSDERILGSAL